MKEKKPINIEVGQRLKQYREEAGMTQETLSELLGLGVKHVSAIERGAVGLSLTTLKQASIVLSVPADVFLFGTDESGVRKRQEMEAQELSDRISRLPHRKFLIVQDILNKLLEALAYE